MKLSALSTLFFSAILLASASSQAENWQPIMTCENGAVTIDVDHDERRHLQVVFRGESMLRKMNNASMISPGFGDTEIVLRGTHAELQQVSYTETLPQSLGGVFHPQDLKKIFIGRGQSMANEVEILGSEILFKRMAIRAGTHCPVRNDLECRGGTYHRTYVFQNEVRLGGCQFH